MLFTDGCLYRINYNELEYDDNRCEITESELIKINYFPGTKVIHFKIIDDQTRILFYTQTNEITKKTKNKFSPFFDQCWIYDLSDRIATKIPFAANGNARFDTVSMSFDTNESIAVYFPKTKSKTKFELRLFSFEEYSNDPKSHEMIKNGIYNSKVLCFEEASDVSKILGNITTVNYLYKQKNANQDLLVLSEIDGSIHLYELVEDSKGKDQKVAKLRDSYNKIFEESNQSNELIRKDYPAQIIKSHDHKFLFVRTALSKIIILKIDEDLKLVELDVSKEVNPIAHIYLSGNGRYLMLGGMFLSSIIRLDLESLRSEGFIQRSVYDLNKEFSQFDGIEENENDMHLNLLLLKFGNYEKYTKFMLQKKKRRNYNDQDMRNLEIKKKKKIIGVKM